MSTTSEFTDPNPGDSARDAWSAFWIDPSQSRCVSGDPLIWRSLTDHWSTLANALPPNARVLDLACGAGVVGRLLLASRPDLHVTGIDSAKIPASELPDLELLSHIAMESMPFPDSNFGVVVSQFGFEYGRIVETTREIRRVLEPGGRLCFLVHHAESAVVAAMRARARAIDEFLAPATEAAFTEGDRARFQGRMAELLQRQPQERLLAELAQGLAARLEMPPSARQIIWKAMGEALAPERRIADAMVEACVTPMRIDEWSAPLRGICDLDPASVLRDPFGVPIAWKIDGRLRAPGNVAS